MTSKRIDIYENDTIYTSHRGKHIILSVEDYNSIVRQLNILQNIVSDMLPQRDGRIYALSRQTMDTIEDD